jgi:hypothetical protein
MQALKKAVTVTGKYTDRSGQEKNRYLRVGTLFERPDGTQCVKIDAIPVGEPGWTGWINFYDLDDGKQAEKPEGGDETDDEVPF